MSNKYKFWNPEGIYFISFSVVNWIDVFIRPLYSNILLDSIQYCQQNKGLEVHAWVIMSSHVHMIMSKNNDFLLENIMRDLKKYTSFKIIGALKENVQESRKEWMLKMFEEHSKANSNNTKYQFWQQDNHPIELTTNEMIDQKLNYIHDNPLKTNFIEYAEDYLLSSARDYSDIKGLLNIVKLE